MTLKNNAPVYNPDSKKWTLEEKPMKNIYYKKWGSSEYTQDGYVINRDNRGNIIDKRKGSVVNNKNTNSKKYIVKENDSFWKIANDFLGNGSKYKDIIDYNNLSESSVIHPGLILNIPINYKKYIIKSGDYLNKIADLNGITVQLLTNFNNIKNPNLILIGQTLNIPVPQEYVPKIREFNEIKNIENEINKKSNKEIINLYHRKKNNGEYYIIDDKKNEKLSLYKNGKLIKSYNAIHGKNRLSDDMTVTKTDSRGKIINLAGNLSTPAGVYFATKTNDYHGAPAFMRRTREQVLNNSNKGIPSSIHRREISLGANTNGCTGMSQFDLKDLNKYIGNKVTPVYILPYNENNKFFIRNGELLFKSYNIQKTPSYNTIVSNPIEKITYDSHDLNFQNKNIINQFSRSLIKNKENLISTLSINNDTYNQLALKALGILGVESGFGNENSAIGNLFRATRKYLFNNNSSPDYKSKYYTYNLKDDNNSIGLTQIRFKYLSDNEKRLFAKYNITKESLVNNPSKAAIATLIRLAESYKNTGHNIDKAVKLWNQKPSYLSLVNSNSTRFKLYEKYEKGGKIDPTYDIFKINNNFLLPFKNFQDIVNENFKIPYKINTPIELFKILFSSKSNNLNDSVKNFTKIYGSGKNILGVYVSDGFIKKLKNFEGFINGWKNVEKNSSIPTTGYGFRDTDGSLRKKYPNGIPRKEADIYLIETELPKRISELIRDTPNWNLLNNNQRLALLDLHYNIGLTSYREKSPNLQNGLKEQNWEKVKKNIDHGENNPDYPGLKERRMWDRLLFESPLDENLNEIF